MGGMTYITPMEVIQMASTCTFGDGGIWAQPSDATPTCTDQATTPELLQLMHPDAIQVSPVLILAVALVCAVILLSDYTRRVKDPSH